MQRNGLNIAASTQIDTNYRNRSRNNLRTDARVFYATGSLVTIYLHLLIRRSYFSVLQPPQAPPARLCNDLQCLPNPGIIAKRRYGSHLITRSTPDYHDYRGSFCYIIYPLKGQQPKAGQLALHLCYQTNSVVHLVIYALIKPYIDGPSNKPLFPTESAFLLYQPDEPLR